MTGLIKYLIICWLSLSVQTVYGMVNGIEKIKNDFTRALIHNRVILETIVKSHRYPAILVQDEAQSAQRTLTNLALVNKNLSQRLQLPKVLQEKILQYTTPIEQYYGQLLPALGFPIPAVLKESSDRSFFNPNFRQLYYDYDNNKKTWMSSSLISKIMSKEISFALSEENMLGSFINEHDIAVINYGDKLTLLANQQSKKLYNACTELRDKLSQEQFYFIIDFARMYKIAPANKPFTLSAQQRQLFQTLPQQIQDNLQKSYDVNLAIPKTWWEHIKHHAQSVMTFFKRHKKATLITIAAAATYISWKKQTNIIRILQSLKSRLKLIIS